MRRLFFALILLVAAWPAQAQETFIHDSPVTVNRGFLRLGAGVVFEMEGTTNNAFEFRLRVDPTEDVNWILPAAAGTAGQQLQTGGGANGETLSWASAGSTRDIKLMAGLLDPQEALRAVLEAPVHRFRYKPGTGTLDSATEYAGIVADEAPWAMHFNGTILNPVNTSGYAFAAIQALQAELDALKAELAATQVRRRSWRTLWLWAIRE